MSKKIVSHSHIITQGSMKIAHNTDDRQERGQLRVEGKQTLVHSTKLSDYTVVDGVVGHIYNGRFVADNKAPLWVRISLTGKGQ